MAKADNTAAWVFGGLATLGLIALASSSRGPAKRTFQDELREELSARGLQLVSAEYGRLNGESVWVVTCETPGSGVFRVEVPVDDLPYDHPAVVAERVAEKLAA